MMKTDGDTVVVSDSIIGELTAFVDCAAGEPLPGYTPSSFHYTINCDSRFL